MKPPVQQAEEIFRAGFNCSQAVLSAFAESLGMEQDLALKVSGPFGGGIGRMGATCGAVTGAVMVLGLRYGRVRATDLLTRDQSYAAARQLSERFRARHGALSCRGLLGFEIGTPEGAERARREKIHEKVCAQFGRSAAELTEELLK